MHLVLGTAGHIDHGKSSLVRALTGTDPDRLPEEKARGVTIDLGFAHLELSDEKAHYEIGIIDVPGHADFVNNMVSGVGALDLAIFIIAADDGWMPQSEEHLHILTYLGIKHVIIAMTKIDLCDDVPFAVEVLRDELQDTAIANAPILPISSITGEGIEELKQSLLSVIKDCPAPKNAGKPRLSIDRLFSPKGTGTVVTGTLSGGPINLGDTLTLQPQGLTTRVRYIQNHSQPLELALPGMRTALNLPDLPIAAPGKPGAQRGNTLTLENCGTPTDTLDIELQRLERAIPGSKPRPLRHTETVIVHHGSTRCRARVILHGRNHLNPGETCLAQLRLEEPLFILTGDRIVIRDGAQQNTLAGGTVLDALPERQGFRTEARSQFLQHRASAPDDLTAYLTSLLERDHQIDALTPLPNNPFSEASIQQTIGTLQANQTITQHGSLLLDASWWNNTLDQAGKLIKSWHQSNPDLPSMPLDRLNAELPDCPDAIRQILPEALEKLGYQQQGKGITHSSHQLTLPADIVHDAHTIMETLNKTGLQPPNKAELTPTAKAQQAMQFLIRSGQVMELEPKVVISQTTANAAADAVRSFIQTQGKATASELRQHLGSTRKVVMPLLELLDSQGLTVRNDNYRTLA